MATISRFYGIAIRMYFNEHEPPHFHALYGEHEAIFVIDTLEIVDGWLPRRVAALVLEWANENRPELRENWQRARRHERTRVIAPLE